MKNSSSPNSGGLGLLMLSILTFAAVARADPPPSDDSTNKIRTGQGRFSVTYVVRTRAEKRNIWQETTYVAELLLVPKNQKSSKHKDLDFRGDGTYLAKGHTMKANCHNAAPNDDQDLNYSGHIKASGSLSELSQETRELLLGMGNPKPSPGPGRSGPSKLFSYVLATTDWPASAVPFGDMAGKPGMPSSSEAADAAKGMGTVGEELVELEGKVTKRHMVEQARQNDCDGKITETKDITITDLSAGP